MSVVQNGMQIKTFTYTHTFINGDGGVNCKLYHSTTLINVINLCKSRSFVVVSNLLNVLLLGLLWHSFL